LVWKKAWTALGFSIHKCTQVSYVFHYFHDRWVQLNISIPDILGINIAYILQLGWCASIGGRMCVPIFIVYYFHATMWTLI
jgi:hypothetical protein